MKVVIKTHWDQNPMNYNDKIHDLSINDLTQDYFSQIDSIFYKKAFFAQDSGMSLFSKIIDYSSLEEKNVLVIGCGWGGMALQIAKDTGAKVKGITLSENQYTTALRRAQEEGLGEKV